MIKLRLLLIVFAAAVTSIPSLAWAQEGPSINAALLKPYFAPRQVTRLEWELMDFNVHWQGAFDGRAEYIISYPVFFDAKKLRFQGTFRVQEQRYYNDAEPFFKLPRPRREAALQSGIDSLKELLGMYFPELLSNPNLLYVEFKFQSSGGGSSSVAKYENGKLRLSE